MTIEFGLFDAGNNWWWAIDNLVVFTPLTLAGRRADRRHEAARRRERGNSPATKSPARAGSLNPAGWRAGNLDAQNVGSATPPRPTSTTTAGVDASDLAVWRTAFGENRRRRRGRRRR